MRRNTSSFNLSFIDIISCGLGAIILLLILIKDSDFFSNKEIKDNVLVLADNSELETQIDELKVENTELTNLISARKKKITDLEEQISEGLKSKRELQREISSLIISDEVEEKKNFLSSCKLDKDKTLVLLDSSASMLAYEFIDVLTAKSSSDDIKKKSDKFNTAKRITEWLIEGAEDEVRIDVATFSRETNFLSEGLKNKKDIVNNADFLKKIEEIVPEGETNLYMALSNLDLQKYRSIFFITDGLPTAGNKNSFFQNLRGCNSGNLVTSDCRENYFTNAISYLDEINKRIQINTILLYLEGDPRASLRYSIESTRTKGCFITIPKIWP
tara:strand:+ start:7624 stop:8613 length:990 start_codon:yes stop_codon:yes gene_type:complete